MNEEEFIEMMDRLCRLACAECPLCRIGLEPFKGSRHRWGHPGSGKCLAADTHDRIEALEREYESQ